jgi:hypothetical protein
MRILVLLLGLCFFASTAAAPAVAHADKKEKVKKKLRAWRAATLIDELELDEATATKLMPILNNYDDQFAKLAQEGLRLRKQAETETEDSALDGIVDDLTANQRARWDLDEKRFKEIRTVLTPRQAARILVVLPAIDRKILEGAKKAIKQEKARKKRKAIRGP